MTHDEGGAVHLRNHVRYRERLAGSGHTEQYLRFCAGFDAVHQCLYRFRLVTCRFVWTLKLKHKFVQRYYIFLNYANIPEEFRGIMRNYRYVRGFRS